MSQTKKQKKQWQLLNALLIMKYGNNYETNLTLLDQDELKKYLSFTSKKQN